MNIFIKMSEFMKIFLTFFFSFKLSNLKITYIFSENSIYNQNNKKIIKNTTLEIINSGEYIIKGNCENTKIIINTNYVTLYFIGSYLNSKFHSLIIINENIKNIIINLNEAILSTSFDSGIFQLKKYSNLIINSKFSILKGGIIIKSEKEKNIKIKGKIGLSDKIKLIDLNFNIFENFTFGSDNEKIKLDDIYMEIYSYSIFEDKDFCFKNLIFFDNNKYSKSSFLNNDTNFFLNTNILENNTKKENNIFYLDYLYFKHVNIAKEKSEEKIIRSSKISFAPKVSVIIPIYNVEKYLMACLDSIVNQTLKEIEIICVNDGSTDNSLSLLQEYSKSENRIMIINQRNRGLSEARNTGVKFSNGEFIYFIDSDDSLKLNALFELYEYCKKNDLDIISFQSKRFKKDKETNNQEINKNLNNQSLLNNSNFTLNPKNIMKGKFLYVKLRKSKNFSPVVWRIFLRKEFYINSQLSFYPGILHEDISFTLTAFLLANRTTSINKKYYNYRIHEESITSKKINLKNLYGYFITSYKMEEIINNLKLEKNVKKTIFVYKKYAMKFVKKCMKKISSKEKKILYLKLTKSQKNLLSRILK